jgi:hypothetical protein
VTTALLAETSPDASASALRERLNSDGYLFLRGLIPAADVGAVRAAVLGALDNCGWLAEGAAPDDAMPSANVHREEANAPLAYFEAYTAIQRLQPFHELAHAKPLVALMERIFDGAVLVHPRKIARIGLPQDDFVVGAHQDFPLNQGSTDVLTAWVPLGACPDRLGGLRVLPGSQRRGLWPVEKVPNVGGLRVAEKVDDGDGWLTTDFEAGDVLVFHSLTVHAAKHNYTDRLRLSSDFRYQAASDPIVLDSLVPHYFPVVPGHEELTKGWSSTHAVAARDDLRLVPSFDPFAGPPTPLRSRLVELN